MVFSEVIPWMVLSGFVAYVVASSSACSLMVFPNCVAYSLRFSQDFLCECVLVDGISVLALLHGLGYLFRVVFALWARFP